MKSQKNEKPHYRRYLFRSGNGKATTNHNQFRGWWLAILVLLVAVGIAGLINFLSANHANKSENAASSVSKIEKTVTGNLADRVQSNQIAQFKSSVTKENSGGITSRQQKSLQDQVDKEQNASVRKKEQKILNATQVKRVPKKPTDEFAIVHTFSSVADAKSWANTTKSQWLAKGYTNFTITSNSQGYYILKFTK